MDTKGLQKEFINWCKSKNKSPKTKEETQQLFVSFMKEKHPEEYKKAVESQQQQQAQQAQKALHGAKLQYFRKLKNQCAEDEEVVYYKKGGSVSCGCKKKENGGEVRKARLGCSAIDKFKAKMKSGGDTQSIANRITNTIATITNTKQGFDKAKKIKKENSSEKSTNVVVNGTTKQPMEEAQRKNTKKPFKNDYSSKRVKDSEEDYLKGKTNEATAEKCGGKVKKKAEGSKINKDCGGSSIVSQFKKHFWGGKLGI